MAAYTRFFTTSFGARIAYATIGRGAPLIAIPPLTSHIELFMEEQPFRAFNEALAADFTLIRYDRYGCGLSDRSRTDFRPEVDCQVLDELIAHLGLPQPALYAASGGGETAIRYAHAKPDRVSRLLLWGVSCEEKPRAANLAVNQMIRANWRMGANTFADLLLPNATPEHRSIFARIIREAASPEMMVSLREAVALPPLTDLLPELGVPTLVLAARDDQVFPLEDACELARRIPNACLTTIESDCYVAEFGDIAPVVRAMREFILPPSCKQAQRPAIGNSNGALGGSLTLSPREIEVLRLVAEGLTDAQVAERLALSPRTVGQHLHSIYNKYDLPTRTAATRFALQHNLI